ncbi:MAG: hypothetical protein F6J93_00630 [Oscillatoria sp. SIO1A7]|nr:hypothetical protein [Oscillatoria sp. SIO1A7]
MRLPPIFTILDKALLIFSSRERSLFFANKCIGSTRVGCGVWGVGCRLWGVGCGSDCCRLAERAACARSETCALFAERDRFLQSRLDSS